MSHRFKVIAFDCDGVMFDTAASNRAYYNAICRHLDMPDMTPEQFSYAHTHAVDDTVNYLLQEKSMIEKAQKFRKTMNYLPFIKEMTMEPHLVPLLRKLRPQYKTAIATNRTDTMGRVLTEHGISSYFDYVVCASDVTHPKPHPEALIKIIDHFNITAEALLYIGDSEVDETAAQAADVTFVAYRNKPLSADFHITALRELEEILI